MMQPVVDSHDRAVRWRQLVDLLSRPHGEIDPALLDAAYAIVRSGPDTIPLAVRAATARSIAGRDMAPALFAIFAADRLDVAAPLLASAKLDAEGWKTVARAASVEVQPLVRSLRGEPALPVAESADSPAPPESEPDRPHEPSISEMVARIERIRREKQASAEPPASFAEADPAAPPPTPSGGRLFRWECDASGQIDWVEGVPRGALIGRNLTIDAERDRKLRRALTERAPFDGAALELEVPAIPARWRLSGIPAFSPVDGRFLGYRGIGSAEPAAAEADEASGELVEAPQLGDDAEALRETIHEIKTPLNAIIGFAEIIDGQYLGPAHRSYRRRAAEIVTQARVLLGAIEDLDFAARMRSPGGAIAGSTRMVDFMPALVEQLQRKAAAASVDFQAARIDAGATVMLADNLVERMLQRFLGAVIEAAASGERIETGTDRDRGRIAVWVTRPSVTLGLSETQLVDPAFGANGSGEASGLGLGFALRLVRGLARLAGGDLSVAPDSLVLLLPAR
jgi:signal transduction histidine kinase